MTRVAGILFFAVVAAQVVGLVAFAGVRQVALTEGREITLQTVPVDPRSLFQGDYAILDYEIAKFLRGWRTTPLGPLCTSSSPNAATSGAHRHTHVGNLNRRSRTFVGSSTRTGGSTSGSAPFSYLRARAIS